jgi:hypothetical protein
VNVVEGHLSPDAKQTHVLPSPAASWLWYLLEQKPESWFCNKVATIKDTRFPSINENEADSAQHFQQLKQTPRNTFNSGSNMNVANNLSGTYSLSQGKSFHLPAGFVLLSIAGLVVSVFLCIPLTRMV